jgi:hypothetical protein
MPGLAPVVGRPIHDAGGLGGDHQFIARQRETLERLAHEPLGLTQRIHIGGVDEIDPGIDRGPDLAVDLILRQLTDMLPNATAAAVGHGAQAEFRYVQAGSAQ